jgi:thioesterase domain-containing protein
VPLNKCTPNHDQSLPHFYFVHSVSGSAGTHYLELAKKLAPHIRVHGIQAPPVLMSDIEFGKSIESIAAFYADALDEFQPEGTLYIGGYCAGAVIALAMAGSLRSRGREVGPLVAIDGAPENTPFALARWRKGYWVEFAQNVFLRASQPKLIGDRSIRDGSTGSMGSTIRRKLSAITKSILGMNRAQKFDGGFSIESILDVSRYPAVQLSFIERLFNAIFEYTASHYHGEVVVYEAALKPFLALPQIGRIWRNLAPRAQVIPITGTHSCMMRTPYVDALAKDLLTRIHPCAP